jgi:hypothetical protein
MHIVELQQQGEQMEMEEENRNVSCKDFKKKRGSTIGGGC